MKLSILVYPTILLTLMVFPLANIPLIPSVMAQEQVLKTLTVTGQGTIKIPTTLTNISLGVEIQGKTAEEVQKNVAQRTSSLVEFLRSRQIEKLETVGIRLQPNYEYNNNQQRLVGYIGTNTIRFRIKTEAVGSILDDAVTAGATRIDTVSFTATETAISQAQKEALKAATLDAQQQAEAVLSVLNFQSQEVINISINGSTSSPPKMRLPGQTITTPASAADTTPIIGGEQTIKATVTLQIRY
ncbi:MAG: SIMPL domain-containing protein [Crocosphaera sp.]